MVSSGRGASPRSSSPFGRVERRDAVSLSPQEEAENGRRTRSPAKRSGRARRASVDLEDDIEMGTRNWELDMGRRSAGDRDLWTDVESGAEGERGGARDDRYRRRVRNDEMSSRVTRVYNTDRYDGRYAERGHGRDRVPRRYDRERDYEDYPSRDRDRQRGRESSEDRAQPYPRERERDYTRNRGRDYSPYRGRDYSPYRGRDYSAHRSRNFSLHRGRDYSPYRGREYSPRRRQDHSPRLDRNYSPRLDRDYSPRHDRDYSPRRDHDYSPRRGRDESPYRGRDYSPYRSRHRYSRRSHRDRRERSISPGWSDRSLSPMPLRSGARKRRRGGRNPRRDDRRRRERDFSVSPSRRLSDEFVVNLFVSALQVALRSRPPPFNISVISDNMTRQNSNWAVWKSNFSSFSELCRKMEVDGHLTVGRKDESVVLVSSKYEPGPGRDLDNEEDVRGAKRRRRDDDGEDATKHEDNLPGERLANRAQPESPWDGHDRSKQRHGDCEDNDESSRLGGKRGDDGHRSDYERGQRERDPADDVSQERKIDAESETGGGAAGGSSRRGDGKLEGGLVESEVTELPNEAKGSTSAQRHPEEQRAFVGSDVEGKESALKRVTPDAASNSPPSANCAMRLPKAKVIHATDGSPGGANERKKTNLMVNEDADSRYNDVDEGGTGATDGDIPQAKGFGHSGSKEACTVAEICTDSVEGEVRVMGSGEGAAKSGNEEGKTDVDVEARDVGTDNRKTAREEVGTKCKVERDGRPLSSVKDG